MQQAGAEDNAEERELSLSIEETNKLRLSLGLKPLEVGSTSHEKQSEENYQKHQEDEAKRKGRKDLADKIQREKELSQRGKVLSGTGLGEVSDDDNAVDDAAAWVLKSRAKSQDTKARRRERRLLQKREQDLQELDNQSYTSVDLAGLRVGHKIDDISGTGGAILVLKDSTIMENEEEGDELVSVALTEHERNQKNLENKKAKPGYNPYKDNELAEFGEKADILNQYNDEEAKSTFTLGSHGTVDVNRLEAKKLAVSEKMHAKTVSLDYEKTRVISDYYTKEDLISFKKPKGGKAKRASSRRKLDTEIQSTDDGGTSMDVDQPQSGLFSNSNITVDVDNVNFVDDDDLQMSLANARLRAATKTRLAGDLSLTQMATGSFSAVDQNAALDAADSGGLVISGTSEFVRTLDTLSSFALRETMRASAINTTTRNRSTSSKPTVREDIEMHDSEAGDQHDTPEANVTGEDGEIDEYNAAGGDANSGKQTAAIAEEPLVSSGLAATMALLNQKGLIQPLTEEARLREAKLQEHQKWLTQRKLLDRLKDSKRPSGSSKDKGYSRSAQEVEDDWDRERAERDAERTRLRELEKRFENYSPDVNIKYHDDNGRELNTKEAWNQLAYKFYGIMPGKLKTEKRLKKLQEELKMKQMSSIDTPLGLSSALQEKTRRTGQAHVTLSVGNHSITPLQIALPKADMSVGARRKATPRGNHSVRGKQAVADTGSGSTPWSSMGTDDRSGYKELAIGTDSASGLGSASISAPAVPNSHDTGSRVEASNRERVTFGLSLGGSKRKGSTIGGGASKKW
ncbi:hypothetical protein BASA60_004434 [Batrachochytrium salamandrivorans]|nr:hypothetical protein BASA60_004434 [Batrachochytrium salamandrivorans]